MSAEGLVKRLAEKWVVEICELGGNDYTVQVESAIREALQEYAASEWVDVRDRMPEILEGFCVSGDVLTWDGVARHIGHIRVDESEEWEQIDKETQKLRKNRVTYWIFEDGDWYEVTHWRPLPQAPTEEAERD